MATRPDTIDYGADGWPYVVGLLGGGTLAIVAAIVLRALGVGAWVFGLAALGGLALIPGGLGWRYVRGGKLRHRDRLLDRVTWRGDEHTLDVGTGGGLLMIGAARRAPRGRACGVDIWSTVDLSNNSEATARRNATLEGVAARVEIRGDDARALSFADGTFDVVVSMLCLHNLPDAAGQARAVAEMIRVCKPTGVILISDLAGTAGYVALLEAAGWRCSHSGPVLDTFPFQRVVEARRA